MPLINCEIELDSSWLKDCVISERSRAPEVAADPDANPPIQAGTATETINTIFQINSITLHLVYKQ